MDQFERPQNLSEGQNKGRIHTHLRYTFKHIEMTFHIEIVWIPEKLLLLAAACLKGTPLGSTIRKAMLSTQKAVDQAHVQCSSAKG
eukprot:scaffold23202_cov18-Tisochrysis_lutea.AAC.2